MWELCQRFLFLFLVFVRQKVTVTENITFADTVSGIQPPDCSKLAKNPKNDNDVTIFRHDVKFNFFLSCFVSLVKFSYWSKFHVNIITGSGIMAIFFNKGLTRDPEIGNTPVWVLPNIWRLGRVMHTAFGKNVSNRMLQNARLTAFTIFELLGGTNCVGGINLPTTQINGVNGVADPRACNFIK